MPEQQEGSPENAAAANGTSEAKPRSNARHTTPASLHDTRDVTRTQHPLWVEVTTENRGRSLFKR